VIAILLGAPGSGKGTQAKFLSAKYGFCHLATGDIFRGEIAEKTSLGLKAEGYVKAGKLVPDDLVTEMVAARLNGNKTHYLLDGFPRNLSQAQSLASILTQKNILINLVAFLKISQQEAFKRMISRRVCSRCGEVYNTEIRPALVASKCEKCAGDVVLRDDDSEVTAHKRLMVFEDITQPMISYYKSESVFYEVNASRPPEEVSDSLVSLIDSVLVSKP
jgi:adenylate kinase